MQRTILCLLVFLSIHSKVHSQYANLGTGTLKNQIWWFDWNGFTISNGASRTFTTGDGLTVTISFSNVQGPVFFPYVMSTWAGAVLHYLYDFSNTSIQPALFSPYTTQNSQFTVNITATRNGAPAAFKFIAADAEGSATSEITTITSTGSNWLCVDFFRNSSQTTNPFGGCNTQTAAITDTWGLADGIGQNPVIATDAPGSGTLTLNCSFNRNGVEGQMAIAFGIFGSVDMGDLPASYGNAQHTVAYTTMNPCNYLPPLPSTSLIQSLKIGSVAGDADPVQTLDDNTTGGDEDGIAAFPLYNGSGSYSLTMPVTNTTGNTAYLTGWFDFNRNGTFDNNEYVTAFIPNNATTATVTWTGLPAILPAGSATGWGFRFRLSSNLAATLNASGYAPDGEVEDYLTNSLVATSGDFTIPDTVCTNTPISIINTSTNASTFYWNFCSGSLNASPTGTNFSSAGFSLPVFMDLVQDGPNYYAFVVNHTGSLSRMNFGNSLLNSPTITNLGSFGGIIPFQAEGIEIQKDGANWIGYIIGGQYAASRILKLNFGTTVANTPTATNMGNVGGLDYPVDFTLQKDASGWFGFTVSADNNTVTRYSFGNSLNNTPVATNLGNIGSLNYPVGIFVIKDGNNYHLFITNRNSNTISRLDFGTSLANAPSGTNLGNPGNHFSWPRDITVIKDCDKTFGFVSNEGTNALTRLDFTNNNLSSVPVTTDLGNIGNMNFPSSISEVFRTGDAVNFLCPNVNSNSITRVTFNNCTASSIPSYTGQTPPPFQYSQPGTYNISLFVDDGLPTQTVVCKQIVVKDCGRVISGVINDYTEVLAFDPCSNKFTVSNSTAYTVGDTVLLIQMKGAVIDSSNTASFGTITDLKNSGNYEFNYVKSKNGNVIELKNIVTRQYDIPVGKVQLVRVPYYQSAVVSPSVTCLPWNGTTGGILVLNVRDTLTMNANIDASGKGFRGGVNGNNLTNTTNCGQLGYNYPLSSTLAAPKGESIASISNNIIKGRGAPANGGGGGADHNSGGGGGGNGGTGGLGGYQYAGCTNAPFDNRGDGAKNISYSNAANKIFMGGGGGSGHANNIDGFQPNGGDGGGIILIEAAYVENNSFSIIANGIYGRACSPGSSTTTCNEGMGGGGGGGTVVLNVNSYLANVAVVANGGNGADVNDNGTSFKHGPGGGGGGGVLWINQGAIPAGVTASINGGTNGRNLFYGNDPWGSTAGSPGQQAYSVQMPVDNIPFKPNIDSVRIKDSISGCASFNFKGFGYINTNPVASWQWYFGDGNTANTQNTSHTYMGQGPYTVKLVVTDINGCRDSITKDVIPTPLNFDFGYQVDACGPLSVQFNGIGSDSQNPYWSFGDATSITGTLNPIHIYPAQNTYIVKYSVSNGVCTDTLTKTINLLIIPDDIILTHDTTICFGTTKQLLTKPALSFCWSPITYLSDPNSPNPITSTPQDITYYYTTESTGNNLVVNGDFSQGNTGFISQYAYVPPPNTQGAQYFVGTNPQAWNIGMPPCTDHTTGNGNMMLVNGSSVDNVVVWSETIAVQPNTNYAFSTWIEHITTLNPARLQFSINGINIGLIFQASSTGCLWQQFYTTWNSGANTSAVISIVNKNLVLNGNDFALDDISFAPVFIKRDSVTITVENPVVKTNADALVCRGTPVQLNTIGAASYSWTPSAGLDQINIPNPVASPPTTTQYVVSGTTINGCVAKDSVTITLYPAPIIAKTADTTICKNVSVQLSVSGGTSYVWSPPTTLDNPNIPNPVASPTGNTLYYVTVTDANTCNTLDSVRVNIHPDPVFTINPTITICENQTAQLSAGGGNIYAWQPNGSLSNLDISNPVASPMASGNYSVQITETTCNTSATLSTTVNVNPLPTVHVTKSNDIDCSNDRSRLNASGAKTYTWTPTFSLDNAAISNPAATPITNTMYVVKGTDASGCSNYDSVLVNFLSTNASGYFMPNAFTPNGDGLNDCYGIRFWGVIQELEFGIYNRWGERIFFTKNPNECWDGTYKGKRQNIGVYVYMIKAKTFCGSTFKKGLFTLAR